MLPFIITSTILQLLRSLNSTPLAVFSFLIFFFLVLIPGKHKVSAHDILEVIFELNQSESSSPINQSESVAENSSINTGQSNSVMENSAYYSGGHSNLSEEQKLQSTNDSDSAEAANSGR